MNIFSNGASHLPQGQRIHLPMQGCRICSSIPGLGRSPGGGTGNPLQYSCLGNPMDRGTLQATVHRVAKSRTWLSTHAYFQITARIFTLSNLVFSYFWFNLNVKFSFLYSNYYYFVDQVWLDFRFGLVYKELGSHHSIPITNKTVITDQQHQYFLEMQILGPLSRTSRNFWVSPAICVLTNHPSSCNVGQSEQFRTAIDS